MGDPTHIPGLPQDVGNSTKAGIFPRMNSASTCPQLATIGQSYCNDNDRFCDSGNSTAVHVAYVKQFGTAAAEYIVTKMGGSVSTGMGSGSGSSGSGSSSAGTGSSNSSSTASSRGGNSTTAEGGNSTASASNTGNSTSTNSSASTAALKSGAERALAPSFSSIFAYLPLLVLGFYILS